MQPGSPYSPQGPLGQPDPARGWQPGYPQPVFQAAPPPAPRGSYTGLIVLIVAAVVGLANVTYPSEFGGCEIEYLCGNEYVSADFEALPGVHDLASCAQAGLPYVQKLYALVG